MDNGFIYFITDSHGHIKIGISKDVLSRLNVLQTSNPYKLDVLGVLKVKNIDDAQIIERELHSLFKRNKLRGEWFESTPVINYLLQDKFEVGGYRFNGFLSIKQQDEANGLMWI